MFQVTLEEHLLDGGINKRFNNLIFEEYESFNNPFSLNILSSKFPSNPNFYISESKSVKSFNCLSQK
jgi:hypothetical protein